MNMKKRGADFCASFWLRQAGFEPAVLHFHCDENAAVGSADLTVHRTVIQHRLTLRVMRDDFA